MSASRQVLTEASERPLSEDLTGARHAAADDEYRWVEDRSQLRHTAPEPAADLVEALKRGDITCLGCLGDHRAGDHVGSTSREGEQVRGHRRRGVGQLVGLLNERASAGVLLPAALQTAATAPTIGNDVEVSDLGRDTG